MSTSMKIRTMVVMLALTATAAFAQSQKVKGVIISRAGSSMTLKTTDGSNQVVVLTDTTDVQQLQGALKARKKEMSMAALIPGLACEVQGTTNAQNQLVATWVRFTGEDLEHVTKIEYFIGRKIDRQKLEGFPYLYCALFASETPGAAPKPIRRKTPASRRR